MTAGHANDAPRVALVHDWLTGMRGGEKVLDALCEIFPAAPLYTLVRVPGSVSTRIEARPIHTSFVQRLPRPGRFYRHYLPLYPLAVELFDFSGYDLVISSSHCAVKSVKVPASAVHVCYCHSPMRYAWDQFDAYFGPAQVGRTDEPADAAGDAPDGALGSGHGGARRPLSRELSICCGEDRPIL